MEQNILDDIKNMEKHVGKLSSAQKILLTTDGSVTTILDVLKGHVHINTLIQEFVPAGKEMARNLDIEEGEIVNYRVVVIKSDLEPLIYAVSLVPIKRLDKNFKEDLIKADIPIGRILKKHDIESRREVISVFVEEDDENLREIFNTNSPMLSRIYYIIHHDEVLISLKETFPYSLFQE